MYSCFGLLGYDSVVMWYNTNILEGHAASISRMK